jgi:hypothetical protein
VLAPVAGAEPAETVRVLLVSSSPVSRVGIRQALRQLPGVELAGEVRSVEEARARLEDDGSAVVLLDALEDSAVLERAALLQGWPLVAIVGPGVAVPRGLPSLVVSDLVPGAVRRLAPELGETLRQARVRPLGRQRGEGNGTGLLARRSVASGTLAGANGRTGTGALGEPLRRVAEPLLLIGSSTGGRRWWPT